MYCCSLVSVWLRLAVESLFCYQLLATKALKDESMLVYKALKTQDITLARQAVSRIVGRDTQALDETGVIKAAVETVAENTSDGVVAPLFYTLLGGAALGFLYKAVNTLDSMVGYQNDRYRYFGTLSARCDDVFNFLPARGAAHLMLWASRLCGLDYQNAKRIYKRDRYNHKSPNSAQTEAVCAGALRVQLAGDAYYFGKLVHKPTIGDALRPVEKEDIKRANRLLYVTAFLALLIGGAVKLGLIGGIFFLCR